ncbi:plasmid maintenance protein [Borreliella turdi]|uniref:plasmid maintenance protein n=1 Tax=Borreliella turdi TaxID=57863 RepID=UPI00124513C6|nr:plasmid maintenance protein [Borreliella turdi]
MQILSKNTKSTNYHNKLQHKLIVLISTLNYINSKFKKYTQKNILYYFNGNLKRNNQPAVKLKTMQNYLYKLEKELKVTTNYYKHLGVNFGTEIYYKLNYPKKECYLIINQYFKEKKDSKFKFRVDNYLKSKFNKNGSVDLGECFNNSNNIKKEERKKQIEKFQIKNYYSKCNFMSKKTFSILNLDLSKKRLIEVLRIIKRIEINLTKNKKITLNKYPFKEQQEKLKKILINTQKLLEQKGYNTEQLKTNIQKVYENYKNKPHFIIENKKYNDLSKVKLKLEKSIEINKENSQKNYDNKKINVFNILVERLKEQKNTGALKTIIKTYLNSKNKLEYKEVFDNTYYYELLEIIHKEKKSSMLKQGV